MYIIYISASIQIWVSTCNKKPFLKILRASTTLANLVDATAPRLTHFTLILGLKRISFDVSDL